MNSFEKAHGFQNWKKCYEKIPQHETGPTHRTAFLAWKDLERRILDGKTIDQEVLKHVEDQKKLWIDLLTVFLLKIYDWWGNGF